MSKNLKGSWTPKDPRMDILATALGKLDNPRRVIGMPWRVGAKKFLGRKNEKCLGAWCRMRRLMHAWKHEWMQWWMNGWNHGSTDGGYSS